MPSLRRFVPIFLILVLVGCAGSYPLPPMPKYEADVYPLSETKAGITIGIDEITRSERAERYFGADLIKEGVVPVSIAVSNHGNQRVMVRPSDILLHRGKEVIDPLSAQFVAATARRQPQLLRSKTEKELEKFFEKVAFKETVISPNETYRGVMFFAASAPKSAADRFLSAFGVSREGGPKIRVGLTNLDSGERLRFGPFSLAFPENAGVFSSSSY